MLPLSRILIPTDFSPLSERSARYAATLARRFHSRLILFHVVPARSADREVARQSMNSFLANEWNDIEITRVIEEGGPAEKIVEYARSEDASLIMMPTHGLSSFRRFLLGSVTAKVLHDAECPVWTEVHTENAPEAHPSEPRTLACAVDLAPENARVLRWGAALAAELGRRLLVVHAIPSFGFHPETYYLETDLRRFLVGQAKEQIAKMLASCSISGAEIHIEAGPVPKAVRSAVEDREADLLVIGRSLNDGMWGRLRTNSYAIIRESPCPVISV
jgi:nucleotide-binding universal stress UspA family protein